ncbi:hypothetical protein AN403_5871 [Pseudomonas fluorescens]|uniref:Uncharacterized protein n=1 Tax=Pseudomonas fluorescens TaxID=294 RepID=A0A0P8X6P5_PSEFL|nr:hypothetical protein AN403_5871 [Pseudomonas fluorescens]
MVQKLKRPAAQKPLLSRERWGFFIHARLLQGASSTFTTLSLISSTTLNPYGSKLAPTGSVVVGYLLCLSSNRKNRSRTCKLSLCATLKRRN